MNHRRRSFATAAGYTSTSIDAPIGLACAQAVAIRGAPHVARRHATVPRALQLRVALDDWERMTSMSVSALKRLYLDALLPAHCCWQYLVRGTLIQEIAQRAAAANVL